MVRTIGVLLVFILIAWAAVAIAEKFEKERTSTCVVSSRDTMTLTVACTDQDGVKTIFVKDIPSDLYPGCQINTAWEACKTP